MTGWLRSFDELTDIEQMAGWVSPRLGIKFELSEDELKIYRPDGQSFLSYLEQVRHWQQAEVRAEQAESQLQALRALLQERGINLENL